ncbi:MAG: hypothetical protein AAGA66_14410 [Bacteroidota bacterium]
MKKHLFTPLLGLLISLSCFAQQPFKDYGYEVKISTLSKGKYIEDFTTDSLVQVGTIIMNRVTGKIVSFVEYDTTHSEATLDPQLISRWMSPDPLAEEFYSWSPYNFVFNNPIRYNDPDGRAPNDPLKPFTRADLSRLGDNAGLMGGSLIQRNRIIGQNFEQDVLHAGNLGKNGQQFGSLRRQREYGISTVIPDHVSSSYNTKGETFANSTFVEVKATGRVSRSSSKGQTLGLINALTQSPAALAGAVPALVLITTADTKVGNSTISEANNSKVAVFQIKTFTDKDGNLTFGNPSLLTNPTVVNDDGSEVIVPTTFLFPGGNDVQPSVTIDRGTSINPADPDQINFNMR